MRLLQILLIASAACANRQSPVDRNDRAALDSAYRIQDEAIKRNDADAFIATLAPDYTVHLRNGVVLTRAQVDNAIRADMRRTVSVERATSEITEFNLRGDTAEVVVTHEAVRTVNDANGTPRRWENGVVHRETWMRTPGGWRIQKLQELQQLYMRRDGVSLNGASSSEIVFDTVRLRSGADTLSAFIARPSRSGRFPAVIVLHANRLSEPYIARTVARLAEAGFVGMAIDIFHFAPGNESWEAAQRANRDAVNDSLNNGFREPRFLRDVQSGIDHLRTRSFVNQGGIGVVGFCGGGWNALLLAAQSKDISAVVAFYAPLGRSDAQHRAPLELAQFIQVPVQYHFALHDQWVTAAEVDRFGSILKQQGTVFERFDYDAQHGFFAHNRQGVFDAADAAHAWSRLVPFLRAQTGRPLRERQLAPLRVQ